MTLTFKFNKLKTKHITVELNSTINIFSFKQNMAEPLDLYHNKSLLLY
ncbi:hypothetical protein ADIMK_4101 [Marinobacterium lacunae]|uniref:Uncharacterized protein n=1 Tax=Marinobacterium lacunae TaxID=1232683 RepID=A0A081FTU9_9GAMM|nr:hypothetical protein ADIMK_4101 [Marinobacterium lacunae]